MTTASEVCIRAVIVDDEPLARRGVVQLLEAHRDCQVVAECRNGRDGLKVIREAVPDVVFLDVQMPRSDAFSLLSALDPGTAPAIVFLTAHEEFALRAFAERALDYLLKPVSQQRFDAAMGRVRDHLAAQQAVRITRHMSDLLSGVVPPRPAGRCLIVPTAKGELVLDTSEVDWIQAQDYCSIVHAGTQRHVIRESLAMLQRKLDPAEFLRVHRSAIIRIDRVRELQRRRGNDRRSGGTVVLRDGVTVPVARRRRDAVLALLQRR